MSIDSSSRGSLFENGIERSFCSSSAFHSVQSIQLAGLSQPLPVLLIDRDGEFGCPKPVFEWILQHRYDAAKSLRGDLKVLGRLHDYNMVAWDGAPIEKRNLKSFLLAFLDARATGTEGCDIRRPLGWQPAPYSTVRRERRFLGQFFCELHKASVETLFNLSISSDLAEFSDDRKPLRQRSFFQHMEAARRRWQDIHAGEFHQYRQYAPISIPAPVSTLSLDRTPALFEVVETIRREPNPIYRCIFRLLAFGGPRISEALHMWQCDVLPRSLVGGGGEHDQDMLVVLLCHPSESSYVGKMTKGGETRAQFLMRRHGLLPRHKIQGYRYVGWKSPVMIDANLKFSEVFWCDEDQERLFETDILAVQEFHSRNRTSRHHPYLFVNTHGGEGFGEPIAYSTARKALARAFRRVGLNPGTAGRRLHGLRHLYKRQLDELGLPKTHMQIAMRHRRIESQESYGQLAADIRNSVSIGRQSSHLT